MIINFISNPWIITAITMVCVFFEMFFAKKWFTTFTVKMKSAKARRGFNVILGILTCVALSAAQLFALCDVLSVAFAWKWVFAAALASTLLYLALEKIFTDSELKELGEAFRDLVSHSDMFDGDLSKAGIISVAQRIFEITSAIDDDVASKEIKTIDAVTKKLEEFIKDGNISEAEKAQAAEYVKKYGTALVNTTTYERYKNLLNK
jgi:hypothetical protein